MTVTIGSLANVPDPGAPIASPWAQDVTRLGVHRFFNKAALDASTWDVLEPGQRATTEADPAVTWQWDDGLGLWVTYSPYSFKHVEAMAAVAAKSFAIPWGKTYLADPVAQVAIIAGSAADIVFNWQGDPTTTGGTARVATRSGASVSINVGVLVTLHGKRAVP